MSTPKFWPLDMDPEGQIYDNVAWDLPGFRRSLLREKNPKFRKAKSAPHLVA